MNNIDAKPNIETLNRIMHIYRSNKLIIAFGTKTEQFIPEQFHAINSPTELLSVSPFSAFTAQLKPSHLWLLHQVHGTDGSQIPLIPAQGHFKQPGDFLFTTTPGHALGVVTADCVPLILYDTANHALAMVHAGWRGAVAGVAVQALNALRKKCGTCPSQIEAFIGPSAQACCYQVDMPVAKEIPHSLEAALTPISATHFFLNLPLLLAMQLRKQGMRSIDTSHNHCTICNPAYCSFRRDKNSYRQLTAAMLI